MIFDSSQVCNMAFCEKIQLTTISTPLQKADIILIILQSGTAAISTQGEEHMLTSNSNMLVVKGEIDIMPTPECTLLCFGLNGIAPKLAAQKLTSPLFTHENNCTSARNTAQTLYNISREKTRVKTQNEQAYKLLCEIGDIKESAAQNALPGLVSEAIFHMKNHFSQLYGIEELSAELCVSKSHLVRVFSKSIGVSPGAYLTNLRLEYAKNLLIKNEHSLEIVAGLCGFSCANYFCKVFKKHVGIPPGEYRKAHGESHYKKADYFDDIEQSMFV